jgi:hypothetical protein
MKTCDICKIISKLQRIVKLSTRIDACTECRFHFYMKRRPRKGYLGAVRVDYTTPMDS